MYKIIGEPIIYKHPKNDKVFIYHREEDKMVFNFWSDEELEKLYLPQGYTYELGDYKPIGYTGENRYPVYKNKDNSVRPIYKGNTYIKIEVKGWVKEVPSIVKVERILFDTTPLKLDGENIRKSRISLLFENQKLKEENKKLLKNKQALIDVVGMLLK